MEYQIRQKENGVAVIALKGRIIGDFQLVDIKEDIEQLVEDDCIHLLFDLSDLEFMNSSGLNFLLRTLTGVRNRDGEVILFNLNTTLLDLMVTTKLNSFFIIEDSEEAAQDYLKESGVEL